MRPYRLSPNELSFLSRLVKNKASKEEAQKAISRVGSALAPYAINIASIIFELDIELNINLNQKEIEEDIALINKIAQGMD